MTKDSGYLLPDVVDPPRISFCISIPNEPNHLLAFWGALDQLGKWWNWQKDGTHKAKDTADVWADVWQVNHTAFMNRDEEGCSSMTDPCCPETNDLLGQILALLKGGATIRFEGTAKSDDFTVDCTPVDFSGEPDQTPPESIIWFKALCLALNRWIDACLLVQAAKMNRASLAPQIAAVAGFTNVPAFSSQLNFADFPFLVSSLQAILDDAAGYARAVCALRDAMQGKQNTYAVFNAVTKQVYEANVTGTDYAMINTLMVAYYFGLDRVNFTVFAKQLQVAHDDIVDETAEDCLCVEPACDPANFNIIAVNDCTVERIDATHWHVTQLHHTPYDAGKRQFIATVRDSNWRCFNQYSATQGESGYRIYDCAGVYHEGVGGGGGTVVQSGWVNLEYNEDPVVGIDTILEIICP